MAKDKGLGFGFRFGFRSALRLLESGLGLELAGECLVSCRLDAARVAAYFSFGLGLSLGLAVT